MIIYVLVSQSDIFMSNECANIVTPLKTCLELINGYKQTAKTKN